MNALTRQWVEIGVLSDIPRQGSRCVPLGDTTIAVFRTDDDRVFALEDTCPHAKGPLSQGIVHGGSVTCPMHNWVVSLETGEALGADEGATACFPVRLEGQTVFVAPRRHHAD